MEEKKNSKKKSTRTSTAKNAAKNNSAKKATVKKNNYSTKKNNVAKKTTNKKSNVVKDNKKADIKAKIAAEKNSNNKGLLEPGAYKNAFYVACIIIIALIAIIITIALCKRVPETKNGKDVVASIDGLTVTADSLYQDLSDTYGLDSVTNKIDEYIASKEVTKLTKANEKYIKQVVDYYKQYAKYYGMSFKDFLSSYVGISGVTNEKEFKEYVTKDYKKTLAVQKYIGEQLSDKEIKKYYNENYSEKLTVRVILVEPDKDAKDTDKAKEEAKSTAKDLIKKLDKVKDDTKKLDEKFEDLAYDNSADSSYSDGGLKKNIMKKDVDSAFWKAASDLKDGEYTTKPVESEYGYYIILRKSSKKKQSLKDVKDEVIKKAAEAKLNEDATLSASAWDELRMKYNFKINSTKMKKAYNKKLKDALKKDSDSKKSSSDTTTDTTEATTTEKSE